MVSMRSAWEKVERNICGVCSQVVKDLKRNLIFRNHNVREFLSFCEQNSPTNPSKI